LIHFKPYKAEVCRERPPNFCSQEDVAACYVQSEGRFLLLHRAEERPQAGSWGVPAGKVEKGEAVREALLREVREETGIELEEKPLEDAGTLYVRYPHVDFTFHMFCCEYGKRPEVLLSDEHRDFRWTTAEEALALPLISGGEEALHHLLLFLERR